MRNIITAVLFFVFMSSFAQTKMTESQAIKLKEKVKLLASKTKSIKSDFVQYKHLDFLSNDIVTKGKLAFKTPNLIKWQYTDPFNYSVLFKGDVLYIDDEGKKSNIDIGSSKVFKQLNGLIVNSVKGDLFDDAQFEIAYYNLSGDNSEARFKPKDKKFANYIKEFIITFDAKGDVITIKMIEPSLDYTKIVFNNKTLNGPISNEVFAH